MNFHAEKTYHFGTKNRKEFSAKSKDLYVSQVGTNDIAVFGLTGALPKLSHDTFTGKFLNEFG